MPLTESWLKAQANKPRTKIEEFPDRDSISVRISVKGKITFQLRYRFVGKAHRLDLGSYPAVSLKEARTQGDKYRAALEQGQDPKQVKLKEALSHQEAYTFTQLFEEWYERYCKPSKASHDQVRRSFELYVLPVVGKQNSDAITANQWFTLLEQLAELKPTIAERLLVNLKQCLQWGRKRELIGLNPLLTTSAKKDLKIIRNVGERVLSDDEIHLVFEVLGKTHIAHKNKLLLKLLLIYGCRVSELRLAKKEDFDLVKGVWTVPVGNHKTGIITKRALLRPITENIKPYIEEAITLNSTDYVFPVSNANAPVKARAHIAISTGVIRWLKRHRNIDMVHWSVHDLRRTMRTNMSSITEPHVAETMIGHIMPKTWRTYDKYDYLEEQAVAYSAWVDRLEVIWKGRT